MKSTSLKAYLVVLHIVVLFLVGMLILAIYMIRSDFRRPGSRLSLLSEHTKAGFAYGINHNARDPVIAILENENGIESIVVAPPHTQFVWNFDRDESQNWQLMIADFGSTQLADKHLQDPTNYHMIVDGFPYGPLDGYPDRELVREDGLKKFYKIEPIERTLDNEVPDKSSP